MKKKLLLILLCMISFNAIHADITWTLSEDGILTISGTGKMDDYNGSYNEEDDEYFCNTPWFNQRDKIKNIVIENGVTSIGNYAFYSCSNLTSVTISNSITNIGHSAFEYCSSLAHVTIPTSVLSIGNNTFGFCTSLSSINIPNSVTSLADFAFYGCSNLTSVTIGRSVQYISYAFENCPNITSIIVEKENKMYDSRGNCNAIIETKTNKLVLGCKNTIIPSSVTSIGEDAFYNCSGLTSITIPNSVTSIGKYAFCACKGLTSITIPNSVTNIGKGIFLNCSGLTSIIVENGNTKYDSRNNCNAIIERISNTLIVGCAKTVIPSSVTSIGENAFFGCSDLTSIIIPNGVKSIGSSAFRDCSSLTSVTLSNSVTSLAGSVFYGCSHLKSITCEATTPPNCSYSLYNGVSQNVFVYVPVNSINAYKKANIWKNFNIQAIPDIYSLIDGDSYSNNSQREGNDIAYTRTFNNKNWQALYIPFSLNYNDWKNDFEIAYINGIRQLDKDDNGTIDETIMDVIKIKSGSTAPNTPYLIKAKSVGEKTFSLTDATLYPAEEKSVDCSTTIAKYTFTGTYSTIPSATMIANNYYAMGGGDLIQSDGSNDLMPYRWYMKAEARNSSYNASNAAKTITINVIGDEEEVTTGVKELQMINDKFAVYDLNGRKVNENSLKPGIYVNNGKKFVVK